MSHFFCGKVVALQSRAAASTQKPRLCKTCSEFVRLTNELHVPRTYSLTDFAIYLKASFRNSSANVRLYKFYVPQLLVTFKRSSSDKQVHPAPNVSLAFPNAASFSVLPFHSESRPLCLLLFAHCPWCCPDCTIFRSFSQNREDRTLYRCSVSTLTCSKSLLIVGRVRQNLFKYSTK